MNTRKPLNAILMIAVATLLIGSFGGFVMGGLAPVPGGTIFGSLIIGTVSGVVSAVIVVRSINRDRA